MFDFEVKAGGPRSRTFTTALVEALLPNCEATVLHKTHGRHHFYGSMVPCMVPEPHVSQEPILDIL